MKPIIFRSRFDDSNIVSRSLANTHTHTHTHTRRWQGVSRLNIYAGASASSTLLTDCKLYWHIYVTPPTDEVDGWKQLPSGAQVGVVVASILAFFCCCCSYLTCCRRRRRHVANNIESDDGDLTAFKVLDDKEDKRKGRKKNRWSKSIYRDFVAIDR